MKTIIVIRYLIFGSTLNAQIILDWDKQDVPGMNKLYIIAEPSYQFVSAGISLIMEYNNKEAEDENLINYSIGMRAGIAGAYPSFKDLESATFVGPQFGILVGKNQHIFSTTFGVGILQKKYRFNQPDTSNWIPSISMAYREHKEFTIINVGIGFPQIFHTSFGLRLY